VALIKRFTRAGKTIGRVHGGVECGYAIFDADGERYLQLDTYGSAAREIPGKTSQSIQLDSDSAAELKRLIARAFPDLS
jgi:hypothetical protein